MISGNTPVVEVDGIYAKLECVNPTGSIKDRIAEYILQKSENKGLLKSGMEIVEATSGNTGIALSHFARTLGYDVTIVMPENMSQERKYRIQDLGAKLVLCSRGDFAEAVRIRDEIVNSNPEKYFNPDQFSNPLNVECHYNKTGQEIIFQMHQGIDATPIHAFVAGVGTGGTLIGVSQALRERYSTYIVAVEPSESNVMGGGSKGDHFIQGIGDGFIPPIASDGQGGLNSLIDEVICVSSEEARDAAQWLRKELGFCVGISSGANFLAAKQLAGRFKKIVTVFPDGYKNYKSFGLDRCEKGKCPYEES